MVQVTLKNPGLYPLQHQVFFNNKRYSICEASTKSGKTHGALTWFLTYAVNTGYEGKNYWWIAPVYPQAEIAYNRMKRVLAKVVCKVTGAPFSTSNDSKRIIKLSNGTNLHFKSGEKPDNLYGEDVYAAVIDEASRMREESWFAVRSTLTATKGPLRIIGNLRGRGNWAYKLARKAEAGHPEMFYSKMTAWDAVEAGVLDRKEIEDARDTLPEHIFNELYLVIPSEDGGNPFGMQYIKDCTRGDMSRKRPVVYGIDLASRNDWTVIIGLDEDNVVSYFDRFRKPWPETTEEIIRTVGTTPTLVDETGVGAVVLEDLQKVDYGMYEGYVFTKASKQKLMERLAKSIQSHEIQFPSGTIVSELNEFEYEQTPSGYIYSAPEGFYDDCVCSLALAQMHYDTPHFSDWGVA